MIPALLLACLFLVPRAGARQEPELQDVRQPVLSAVAREFAEILVARRPWLARERGWPEQVSPALGRYGAAERGWWINRLERLRSKLDAVALEELTPQRRADHSALVAQIDVELILASARAPERWDASSYVLRVERMLFTLQRSEDLSEDERWHEIGRVLAELPVFWANARHSLVTPLRAWNERAVGRLNTLERYLRTDLFAAWESAGREDQAALLEEAARATLGFRGWLMDSPASLGGTMTIVGGEPWKELVHAASGFQGPLVEIKKRLLRELLAFEREHGAGDEERPRGQAELESSVLSERVRFASGAAVRLAADARLVDPTAAVQLVPTFGWQPVCGRDSILLPGASKGLVLLLGPLSGAGGAGRLTSAVTTKAAQTCLAVRRGFPGEALLHVRGLQAEGTLRRYLWNRSVHEGWGLFVLAWTMRPDRTESPFAGQEDLAREAARMRRLEAARLLAALEVHAEGLSLPEAAEAFRRRSGSDLESAQREVRCAQRDPLLGIGYLGYLELSALAGERERESKRPVMAPVLSNPHARPLDLRRELLAPGSR